MFESPRMVYEADLDRGFASWITGTLGAERIRQCLQCGLCSAACPLAAYMDYTPRRLIHLAREGFRREVLSSRTIWLCASCYACATQCPKEIDVTGVMHAMKQRAIREGTYPRRYPVPVLEREFFAMVRSRGRVSESWLVILLTLKTNVLKAFGFLPLGWRLLRTGRFSLRLHSIKRRKELQRLLDAVALPPPGGPPGPPPGGTRVPAQAAKHVKEAVAA